jgi:hypothetical protein
MCPVMVCPGKCTHPGANLKWAATSSFPPVHGTGEVALAAAMVVHGKLEDLPISAVKEIECVLDLKPPFLWVVGPDCPNPPSHVFEVTVSGNDVHFSWRPGCLTPPA